jgi:adenylyltransferase/sulfurtransferase
VTSRYARQIVLPEIGEAGQALLAKARILVVGAGGLGSPALLYLAAAGVGLKREGGCIGIIDDDRVDQSNLQRQIIFRESDQESTKVEAAAAHLAELNSETQILTYPTRLSASNVLDILADFDVIIDGTDNFATKYLLNDAAARLGKPVVYGSILGFEGQVSVFWATHGPCYRCIYPEPSSSHIPNCAEAGTLGGIAGVVGAIQAVEACKLALGIEHFQQHGLEPLLGQMLIFDSLNWDVRKLELRKNTNCPICSSSADDIVVTNEPDTACHVTPSKSITLRDLANLCDAGIPLTLIDVREAAEWANGHLEGALHIPLGVLLTRPEVLDDIDRETLTVVYCQHGIRSARAVSFLQARGFEALNLLVDWPA